jgi:hypothetical protein
LRCAGDVAVGYNNPQFETSRIVKMFDILVVLPALFKDNDTRRRELYGKAGSLESKTLVLSVELCLIFGYKVKS